MIPVILGATAAGKSAAAIELAKLIDGEIISCDSRQIYKYMDIVTAKPTREEQKSVRHHLIDIVEPDAEYSAADWARGCAAAIEDIKSRGKRPIICGGTFFYIDAMRNGLNFSSERNLALRKEFEDFAARNGYGELYEILQKENPARAAQIHPNDRYRVVRALVIERGEKSELPKNDVESEFSYFILDCPRDKLYERINARTDKMLADGLFEEYEKICEKYPDPQKNPGRNCVGYREFDEFFKGARDFADCVNLIKQHSRNFAKRQLTWLRNKESGKMQINAQNYDWDGKKLAQALGDLLFLGKNCQSSEGKWEKEE